MPGQRQSTSRLRSKTSDISDLLRGSRPDAKQPETHLAPPMPPTLDADSQTRVKHKMSFFGRRRKSSTVSPSSAKSAETRAHVEEEVPPVPHSDASRLSTSHAPSDALPQKTSGPSSIPVPSSLRHLRTQKSTSFEFSRRSNDSERTAQGHAQLPGNGLRGSQRRSRPQSGERPIITVWAPPLSVNEDERTYTAPRAAPSPPQKSIPLPGPPGSAGKPRNVRDSPESPRSGPTSPTSPHLQLQFPVPPHGENGAAHAADHAELSADDVVSSRASVSSTSSTRETLASFARAVTGKKPLQKHASAIPLGLPKPKNDKRPSSDMARSAPESSLRSVPSEPSLPTASPPRSRIPAASSFQSNLRKVPPPLLTTLRRSPKAGPPAVPLPSPPLSAPPRSGGDEMAAMPTIPSLASHMSIGQVHEMVFRSRANTATSLISASTTGNEDRSSSVEPSTPISPIGDRFPQERDRDGPRMPAKEQAEAHDPHDPETVDQLREALNAQIAKYKRLSSYLLTLSERHSVEKSELMRRVEALEHEARKREREITGLRWLVMNAGQRGAVGSDTDASPVRPGRVDRLRSGSASQKSSPGFNDANGSPLSQLQRGTSMDSNVDSVEEGLLETQRSVSDLIAPPAPSPPNWDAIASPVASGSPISGSIRRSNTMPDVIKQFPSVARKDKQSKRTSSPVLPASTTGLGLGLDIPSMPSLPETDTDMTPAASSSGSAISSTLPSLTAANTASSGLSVIPETPTGPRQSSDYATIPTSAELEGARREKEERRASRALHRISASSTTSSVSASAAYGNNLKIGTSPSIGQVLDRVTEKEPDMDTILQKLRAFGSD